MNLENHPSHTDPTAWILRAYPKTMAATEDREDLAHALKRVLNAYGWEMDSFLAEDLMKDFGRVAERLNAPDKIADSHELQYAGPTFSGVRRRDNNSIGHAATIVEDTGGSNPSAPANLSVAGETKESDSPKACGHSHLRDAKATVGEDFGTSEPASGSREIPAHSTNFPAVNAVGDATVGTTASDKRRNPDNRVAVAELSHSESQKYLLSKFRASRQRLAMGIHEPVGAI